MLYSLSVLTAATCGIASHVFYFTHGEHHLNGFTFLRLALLAPFVICYGIMNYTEASLVSAVLATTAICWTYLTALWTSMSIYRVFFHRLNNFPGPFPAKVTKIWHSRQAAKFHNYKDMDELHAQYGDFVRTGPNEISIADPAAIDALHGPGSKCSKPIWYDLAYPAQTLQLCRDRALHDKRRKTAWDRAFNSKSVRSYESRVVKYADELMARFRASKGEAIDVQPWSTFYSADVLFDLAFGKSFEMVATGEGHWFLDLILKGSSYLAAFGPIPWFFNIAMRLSFIAKANKAAMKWITEKVEERRNMVIKEDDVMSWLLNPTEPISHDPADVKKWEVAEARLLIVAGTDTTSSTLTYAFYRLCRHPGQAQKIQDELDKCGISASESSNFSVHALQELLHLNAFIDEVLRLHPAVPSGLYRNTPPEGLYIGKTFIPGDVTVVAPTYVVQRSPKAFIDPESFVPERFTTQPELILNKRAYAPFNTGAYSCVGRQLALMELRTVLAKSLLNFDITFAEGEDGSDLLNKTKDYFVLGLAPLRVKFTERSQKAGLNQV